MQNYFQRSNILHALMTEQFESKNSLIIPEDFKSLIVSFFEGIDLDKPGIIKKGKLTIKTTIGDLINSSQTIDNVVLGENGIPIATIERTLNSKGKVIQTRYALRKENDDHTQYKCFQLLEGDPNMQNNNDVFLVSGGLERKETVMRVQQGDEGLLVQFLNSCQES